VTPEQLLARLVAFPTVAGTSNLDLVADAASRLEAAGASVTVSEGARADGHNLHAVLGPADVPGLLLSAHTDVVAVDGQAWSRDPFALHAEAGRLYGRGTADMKGFIAAVLAVAAELDPARLRRPVHVVLSSDEELGCRGIRPLLPALGADIAAPSLTVVGEPTRLRVVERHKGKLALRIDVHGRACHSSRAPDGVNAVEYAARLISALDGLRAALAGAARDDRFAVPHATLSTGPIAGGVSLNIVPDACTCELEVRLLPGQPADPVLAAIRESAARLADEMGPDGAIAVTTITEYPALGGDGGDPGLVALVARSAGTRAGGAADYGTEAGLLEQAIGGTVVVCGPGDMAQAHRPDEFIEAAQLDAAAGFLRRLIAECEARPGA
jgi:acetylornithine deacetylase